jgi:peptide/nickel transport system substrate-binding protein
MTTGTRARPRYLTPARKTARACLVLAAAGIVLAACSSGTSVTGGTSGGTSAALTLVTGPSGPFVPNYNPFSTSNAFATQGGTALVYEPLMQFNILKANDIYPWLATSWSWSNGGRKLTLQIRKGVTWSDGKPFTAADVAFTLNLIKKYPALNTVGVSFLSASAPSATEAVLTFPAPAYGQLFLVSQVLMVPEHIWAGIKNPVTYTNLKPVGTGPYLMQSSSAQAFTMTRNPHYWQAGKPKIATLRFVQYASNTSADLALEQGSIDWASLYLPHYQTLFVAKDPAHNHVYLPPTGVFFLCPNLSKYPFNNVTVRQALNEAIDRQTITKDGEGGFYTPATNPTGLVLPNWKRYLAPQYASLTTRYDPSGAKALLEKAGFKPGVGGMLNEPNGTPFKVAVSAPAPYTDWMTDTQLIVNEMRAAGIDASVNGQSLSAWTNAYTTGNYDMTFCGEWTESGPYDSYHLMLDSSLSAPAGKPATGDFERWNSKATDAALAQYAGTNDQAAQLKAMASIESTMVKDVPLIPLFYATGFGDYTSIHAVGWPSASDPYETPDLASPWDEVVLLHLRPA